MIEAESFINIARDSGFEYYTGVPCSFLTPFINYVINDDSLNYISSANEGDALATAAGLAIAGKPAVAMMQNSGLGNAVSPLTSLNWVFRIPVLIITTHRGAPDLTDEPQHELMGKITPSLFEIMQTPWEYFPEQEQDIAAAMGRAMEYMKREQRPYAFIMRKGTVAKHELNRNPLDPVSERQLDRAIFNDQEKGSRQQAIRRIVDKSNAGESVVIASTGYSGRELFANDDRANQFYMVGSMGCASALGLGVSLARPDLQTIVIDGDGAALMRMGNFATLGSYAKSNLVHILLDNEVHDSTGAQATVAANVRFADIAAACGYGLSYSGSDIDLIDSLMAAGAVDGPRFGHLKIKAGTIKDLPRPDISPEKVLRRLMKHIGTAFFD